MKEKEFQEKELFVAIFMFFKRYFILLFAAGLIGGAIGYVLSKQLSKKYEYNSLVCSELVRSNVLQGALNTIYNLIENNEHAKLSTVLGIDQELAQKVEAIGVKGEEGEAKSEKFGTECVEMKVVFSDSLGSKSTVKAIYSFLNGDPNLRGIRESKEESNLEFKNYLDRKSEQLDSIQTNMVENKQTDSEDLGFADALAIGVSKNELNHQMAVEAQTAYFINDNWVINKKHRRGLNFSVGGAVFCFFLVLIILLLKELNQYSKYFLEEDTESK